MRALQHVDGLVHAPRVLLLDEPTTGVDPVSRREFWQILYSLRAQGVAMVISTAYLDEAERCDRLALLNGGRIMYCDTPQRLKTGMPGAILRVTVNDPRRLLDVSRLEKLGWKAQTDFRTGVAQTYQWFLDNRATART